MSKVISIAHPNFALIKYWGKADLKSNTPAMSSISLTIDTLSSTTKISKNRQTNENIWILNGKKQEQMRQLDPTLEYLNRISNYTSGCIIESNNNFPTSAGLASSASGIASLVTAYDRLFGLNLKLDSLVQASILGSGSAPRSLLGGFVILDAEIGLNCETICQPEDWPLSVLICITDYKEKTISSREGMEISRKTSPLYKSWLDSNKKDIQTAKAAIDEKSFNNLGEIAEKNCYKMLEVMKSSDPSINYLSKQTIDCINKVRKIRDKGIDLFYTLDAGPQLKIICKPEDKETIKRDLEKHPSVLSLVEANIGFGARVINES